MGPMTRTFFVVEFLCFTIYYGLSTLVPPVYFEIWSKNSIFFKKNLILLDIDRKKRILLIPRKSFF